MQTNISRLLLIYLTSVFFITVTSYTQEQESPPEPVAEVKNGDEYNAEQIIEMSKPSLVSIWYHTDNYYSYYSYVYKDTTLLSGSGFIFDESGIIGTNFHVIDGIDSLLVKTSDGTFYNAELLIVDDKNDMAVIRIINPEGKKFPVVKLGNSDAVKVGQEVFAIGSPLGYEYTISQGIIAGIRENEKVSFTDPVTYMPVEKNFEKVIQITAAISPGNSGGALFNKKAEVIGITTYTYTGYGNLNFALAINSFGKFKNAYDLATIDSNPEAKKKKEESLFYSNLHLAQSYKEQVTYNWYYTKYKDTMKVVDSFVVQQDSIVRLNYIKAENYYNKCINMQPDSFYVYQELMDLYVFTEHYVRAEDFYKTIRDKFQSDSLLNLLSTSLANAYTTSKEYKKALHFYEKLYSKDTTDIYIQYQIAFLHEKMNNYEEAIIEYRRIIRRDAYYYQAYIDLGKIYFEHSRDFSRAKKYFQYVYEKETINNSYSSYNFEVLYYLGLIAVYEGKKLDAILCYLELKQIYSYSDEENAKKLKLYKAIKKLNN